MLCAARGYRLTLAVLMLLSIMKKPRAALASIQGSNFRQREYKRAGKRLLLECSVVRVVDGGSKRSEKLRDLKLL